MIQELLSFKIKNYKSFGEEYSGFDSISRFNILVGKNNSGKTALVDAIEEACKNDRTNELKIDPAHRRQSAPASFLYSIVLDSIYLDNMDIYDFKNTGAHDPHKFKKDLENATYHWAIPDDNSLNDVNSFIDYSTCSDKTDVQHVLNRGRENYLLERLYGRQGQPLYPHKTCRLNAERDILPEKHSHQDPTLEFKTGSGITNLLHLYLNDKDKPSELVQRTILRHFNEIVSPDIDFQEIVAQHDSQKDKWEIYLRESGKNRVSLSQSGSGFKTVLIVLTMLHLLPHFNNLESKQIIYIFEELENNLHPSIVRRLMKHISSEISINESHAFITTHSPNVIDYFASIDEAQVTHVRINDNTSTCSTTKSYTSRNEILDDLGIRASEILQTNCVIWVEGPSDRIYINRWIELQTQGRLKEREHYQCLIYAGKLLSHFQADPDANKEDLIEMLVINRKSFVVIDSDKKDDADDIRSTKKRIVEELDSRQLQSWVTKGREIENYLLPQDLFGHDTVHQPIHQYEKFTEYINGKDDLLAAKFAESKPTFAREIAPKMTYKSLESLDLKEQVAKLVQFIDESSNT